MNDNAHAVIAQVASNGTLDQQEWAKEAVNNWEAMQMYMKSNGWVEPGSTLKEKVSESNTLSAWSDIITGKKNN